MSKRKENSKNAVETKRIGTPGWIWILCAVPMISALMYFLIIAGYLPFIKAEKISISGILVLFLAIFVWGACGYIFAYFRAGILKSLLIANAFPILCTVLYTVFAVAAHFGAEKLLSPAYMSAIGMGLFSYVGTFAYKMTSLQIQSFEVYIDLLFTVFVFFIGYTVGKSKRLKA